MSAWSKVSWDELPPYPQEEYPPDHPWPPGGKPDQRVYSHRLGCEHHVFSILRYPPGAAWSITGTTMPRNLRCC